jgi:hypothetical protein
MSLLSSASAWVIVTRPPAPQIVTLEPAAPLKLVAGLSGDQRGDAKETAGSSAEEGHHPGAFSRFFARLHTKKPATPAEQRPFHKLVKSMRTKQAADTVRVSATTDLQKELPPPGSRLTLPAAPHSPMLEADVQAIWHAGAPADSHEHECVPSALARARSSLLERAAWSYLVTEKTVAASRGDAGVDAVPGLSVHADIDVPAEAAAAAMDQAKDAPSPPANTAAGTRKAQTIAFPAGQPPPPEVAGLQGPPGAPEKPHRKKLPPAPPVRPEPPSPALKLLALLAGFVIGGIGGVFIRPRERT